MPGGRAGSGTGCCQVVASGSSPAHRRSAASGLWPSSGGPVRTLTEASSSGSASSWAAASSLRLGRGVVPLAGRDVLGDAAQGGEFFGAAVDQAGPPVDHGAAVVDGVLEHRPGQHQPLGEGDGDADGVPAVFRLWLATEPCRYRAWASNPYTVGITIGHPPMTTPRWATIPASRTAYSHARSACPSARSLRCRVRSVTDGGGPAPAGSTAAGMARP